MQILYILLIIPFGQQLIGVGCLSFLVWFFILCKYRNLGLRMFFVFSLVTVWMCYWLYNDIQDEKSMAQNGQLLSAAVLEKARLSSTAGSSVDNQITIYVQFPNRRSEVMSTSEFISNEEFNALTIGQRIKVLYNSVNQQAYYTVSFERYKSQQWILYILPAFFFVIGIIIGLICRNYQVGVHDDTGDEYIEKDGVIILDEKGNSVARTMKHLNIAAKLFQAFR